MTQIRYTILTLFFLGIALIQLYAQPTFSAIPDEASLATNTEVCVDIVAYNFMDLVGFGFPITWDETVLQFQDIRNINAPGLSRDNFDTSASDSGRLRVAWAAPDNFPASLNNGFVLFKACFSSNENCGGSTTMNIDTTGMAEGSMTYADRGFSINDEIVGVNIGFYDRDATLVVPCPCDLEAQIVSTSPTLSDEGYIDLCLGESLVLEGAVDFEAGFEPTTGLTYIWDLGDGVEVNAPTLSHTYANPGIYTLTFKVEDIPTNCQSNTQRLRVRVAPEPIVELIEETSFCPNELITLSTNDISIMSGTAMGALTSVDTFNVVPEAFRADTLLLPDGEGVAYQSQLVLDVFEENATVQQTSDIIKICANMEHTWARDLRISLTCPNGNTAVLHDFVGQTGNRIRLGEPNENDNAIPIPGIGYTYCWSMNASNGTWLDYNDDTNSNNRVLNLPAGDYQPVESFSAFIGCPLNGAWTLKVEDLWAQDNGYIFNWGILFDEALVPEVETFSPAILDFAWQDHPDAQSVSADVITLLPSSGTSLEVPYIVTDELGCIYEQTLNIPLDNTASCGCTILPRLDLPSTPKCSGNGQAYSVRVNTDPQNTLTASSGIIAGGSGFLTVYNIPIGENVTIEVSNSEACTATVTIEAPNCNNCPPIAAPQSLGNIVACESEALPSLEINTASLNSSSEIRWYIVATGGTAIAVGNSFTPPQAGIYYAEIYDTATNCQSPRTLISLELEDAPIASITGDLEICPGERTVLTANGGLSYIWSNFARSNKVGVRAGTYSVTVTDINGCQAVASITVTERNCSMPCPQKSAPQSNGNAEVCVGESIPPLSVTGAGVNLTSEIRWYAIATGGVALSTGFEFTPTQAGTYYAEIYDTSNNCPSPRRAITLSIIECIGTSPNAALTNTNTPLKFEVQAIPNPFQAAITLHFQHTQADWVKIVLYDLSGKEISRWATYYEAGQQQITLNEELFIASGIYFCRLETNKASLIQKLVKK